MKKKQDISPLQFFLVLLGVVAWVIAGYFASQEVAVAVQKFETVATVPNNVAAAGLLGFSIAGGCCFLAVGISGGKRGNGEPPTAPPLQ
jgi:hypothetical protein